MIPRHQVGKSGRSSVRPEQATKSLGRFDGFDRFGRPVKQQWTKGTATIEHFARSYDSASNLLTRKNVHSLGWQLVDLDRTYAYDDLNRMQSSDEAGTGSDRYWKLDQLGNQQEVRLGLPDRSFADSSGTIDGLFS